MVAAPLDLLAEVETAWCPRRLPCKVEARGQAAFPRWDQEAQRSFRRLPRCKVRVAPEPAMAWETHLPVADKLFLLRHRCRELAPDREREAATVAAAIRFPQEARRSCRLRHQWVEMAMVRGWAEARIPLWVDQVKLFLRPLVFPALAVGIAPEH
jgi:hypothetical protein